MRFLRPYRANRLVIPGILVVMLTGFLAGFGDLPIVQLVWQPEHWRQTAPLVFGADAPYGSDATAPIVSGFYPVVAEQTGRNVYNGDLVVEPGETIQGDAIVYDGDVTIRSEGRIARDLIVYSGDINIESGGAVDGDVAAFNGDVDIAGAVGGDIASWSGDVNLAESGRVAGNISIMSGDITRQEGATVGGSIVRGPSFRFPLGPGRPFLFDIGPNLPGPTGVAFVQPTVWERLGRLMLRMLGAGLLAVLLGLLAGALVFVRPELVDSTYAVIQSQTALSFVAGLLANLVLLFLGLLLTLTLCLFPVALIPLLLLFAINLIGITAIARAMGQRLADYFSYSADPAVYTGVGTLVLVGITGFLFTLGSCFQVIGILVLLFVGSLGSGGVLLPWLRRYALQPRAADVPSAPTEPTAGVEAVTVSPDDFTRIKGIGPVFDQRLKEANILTFAQLASMSAEEIAEIIGWPATRVERSNIIEQARALAGS